MSASDLNSRLHADAIGSGEEALVILHGMLGSSRNWRTAARELSAQTGRVCWTVDLPNHGRSPRFPDATFDRLWPIVADWIETTIPSRRLVLMGHSFGGKLALRLACERPEWIERLILVDISPKVYAPHYASALTALHDLDLASFGDRREIDAELTPKIPDAELRGFLLTNLSRTTEGVGFRWQCALDVIVAHQEIWAGLSTEPGQRFPGPSDVIYGEESHFVDPVEDLPAIQQVLPKALLHGVPGAGHNVHVENRPAFVNTVANLVK